MLPQLISLDRLYLDTKNPRHDVFANESEVIEYLCSNDQVYQLAKDIVENGLNPLESVAVVADGYNAKDPTYIVVEGNRRLCALKLLSDPELAPTSYRTSFRTLSEKSPDITELPAHKFASREEAKKWLLRIHGGQQGGVGRRSWNAEQKARFDDAARDRVAQQILDVAVDLDLLTSDDRKRKLTTVSRYVNNANLREKLGIDVDGDKNVLRTATVKSFRSILTQFVADLLDNTVNSRSNMSDIEHYASNLGNLHDCEIEKLASPVPLTSEALKPEQKPKPKPRPPRQPSKVKRDVAAYNIIGATSHQKLESLYYSITDVNVKRHTALVSLGVWAFFEVLSKNLGKIESAEFLGFFNSKLGGYGFSKQEAKDIKTALSEIQAKGNIVKHGRISSDFDPTQLINNMEVLAPLILAAAKDLNEKS